MTEPFNPLSKRNLGHSVAEALLAKAVEPLPLAAPFEGAGIYAIYYAGSFKAYQPIAQRNRNGRFTQPIYVGKAVPAGARKGGFGLDAPPGNVLYQRLNEHTESIQQAANLAVADFQCRHLSVDDIWIPLGESLLIEMFAPLWNKVVDGFGNHDPGSGRHNQQMSPWDVLHPGRRWAAKLQPGRASAEILREIEAHFIARDIAAGSGG